MQSVLVRDKATQTVDEYVGLRYEFPSPYHLYLHTRDLQQSPFVRFIVMSMGKRKLVMVGYYRDTSDFYVSHACRYQVKDLIKYTKEWADDFDLTSVVTKNRIQKRVEAFLGYTQNPILTNRDDYIQLKAWLATQPQSKYWKEGAAIRIRDIISDEYQQRLRENVPQFSLMDNIIREINRLSVTDDILTLMDLQDDLDNLMISVVQNLGEQMEMYEESMNIVQHHTRDERVVSISKLFYEWISRSIYSSDTWYNTLDICSCKTEGDPGCQVETWGEDISYV